ncbi:E3 ubiquitin-protein ligase LNX-like [Physella acuta]|uniref:E3 ubiquitin-protein ligase LNX-like n=1 Tax=Physella acuta TaxID=109671 RepID=UPI0027DD1AD3|nr:E3 ubiquitin-protein ligase LNX-like [Physella acuta]XP_059172083.1 E3 ubiquitin-protein ligase LNX-like [Physella acuta]XP_059172084.1 E3 ubiquitin-protein ligase LNX-like [Physella acuta]
MNQGLAMSLSRVRFDAGMCVTCGQLHEAHGTHLYDYHQQVDEDLMCQICLQPLVTPVDTLCGHTFCSRCIHNYLALQQQCPIDRKVLTLSDCQPSSILVRRLLDKLLVVCPNVDYCEEVLTRCELEAHLLHRCRGAVTRCIKSSLGCSFQGPRSALQSHLWECPYRDQNAGKNPVTEGEVSTIEVQRKEGENLGVAVVGGCDTPLVCTVIQEVFADGAVSHDGRLIAGDQILEVNGEDLTQATHHQAVAILAQFFPVCRLTVYRERAEESRPIEKEEILKITLSKVKGKPLGIKLVGKRNGPGVYILTLIPGSLASCDGRLKMDDRVLEINGQDVSYGTQEQAASIIVASQPRVQFVVARKSRPQTPDIIRSAAEHNKYAAFTDDHEKPVSPLCYTCKEKIVTINKDPTETLGVSIAGGLASHRGDIPVYITNINLDGCVGRTNVLKKGDVLVSINNTSLLNMTHLESVKQIRASSEVKVLTLRVIDSRETTQGDHNFTPSWIYWLQMPQSVRLVKTITLLRSPAGSLGFSIVGGADCSHGCLPIFVKSVVPDTPASKDGRLKCGDILLSVNEHNLRTISHAAAVEILKHIDGAVTLSVVSWPGTVV